MILYIEIELKWTKVIQFLFYFQTVKNQKQ